MSLLIFLTLITFKVFSQVSLETVEVVTAKDSKKFNLNHSTHFRTEQIENQSPNNITELIQKVPGVVSAQDGGPGGRISFFIRGSEGRHVSYTLDGLRLNDPSNTDRQFDTAFMTSPFIKELSVHKGPWPVMYGSDAMAGLIEMETRRGENAPESRFIMNLGSFGTISSTLSKDWGNNYHHGTLTLTRFHTDGISRLNEKRFNAKEKDASDITQLVSSSEHVWSNKWQTAFLFGLINAKSEQDGLTIDEKDDFSRNDQYLIQQKSNYLLNKNQTLSIRNGLNRHQRFNKSAPTFEGFYNGDNFQNEVVYSYDSHEVYGIAGLVSDKESMKSNALEKSFDLTSLFVKTTFVDDFLKFFGGARFEDHSKYGEFLTGSGGVSYKDFSFVYSRGYKAPSLYQLFAPDILGAPVGNPDLIPESNHAMDLSWKHKGEHTESHLSLFQNSFSNLITYIQNTGFINQQRFVSQGAEVSGKVFLNQWSLSISFTHQQFKENQVPVLRRPYNLGMFNFSYFPSEDLEYEVLHRWYSARKDTSAKLNGFEVVDFSIKKRFGNHEILGQIKNILNREYEEIYGYSVLPRSFFMTYRRKFD